MQILFEVFVLNFCFQVQENHHASLTAKALRSGGLYPSKLFPDIPTFNDHRKLIIEAILATDMSVGFQVISDFRVVLEKATYAQDEEEENCFDTPNNGSRRSSLQARKSQTGNRRQSRKSDSNIFHRSSTVAVDKSESEKEKEKNEDDRPAIFQPHKRPTNITHLLSTHKDAEKHKSYTIAFMLKCADFSHFMRDFPVHAKWSQRVHQEFFRQGDEERRLVLPVGALNDRTKVHLPKSQLGCISFLILPMIEPLFKFFGTENPDSKRKENNINGENNNENVNFEMQVQQQKSHQVFAADSSLSIPPQPQVRSSSEIQQNPPARNVPRPQQAVPAHEWMHEMQNSLFQNQQSWRTAGEKDTEKTEEPLQVPTSSASGRPGVMTISKPATTPSVMGFRFPEGSIFHDNRKKLQCIENKIFVKI